MTEIRADITTNKLEELRHDLLLDIAKLHNNLQWVQVYLIHHSIWLKSKPPRWRFKKHRKWIESEPKLV